MALSLFRKSASTEPVYALYAAIVAQSRQPRFYAEWGVPDTVTGRFDMISLHLALVLRRLRADKDAKVFSQALFDLFFKDMDRSLREMGAGDLAVPKKIRKMGAIFYGLLASLDTALTADKPAEVEAVLLRNIYAGPDEPGASPLANYLIEEARRLALLPSDRIVAGHLDLGAAA
ncbi:MAG: ubiquinol-cytochrome C chaperone family protein [Devosia sp.]